MKKSNSSGMKKK